MRIVKDRQNLFWAVADRAVCIECGDDAALSVRRFSPPGLLVTPHLERLECLTCKTASDWRGWGQWVPGPLKKPEL